VFVRVTRLLFNVRGCVCLSIGLWLDASHELGNADTSYCRPEPRNGAGVPSSRLKVVNLHLANTGPGQEEESTE
jgi:hypothetical protein